MALSKSLYVSAHQCEKLLWFSTHRKDDKKFGPQAEHVFRQGNAAGDLARDLVPGGELIDEERGELDKAVTHTQEAMARGVPAIYEATFKAGEVLVRVDLLVKAQGDQWDLLEVKSAAAVANRDGSTKEQYLQDVAVQRWVLSQSGVNIDRCILVHINNKYVRQGDLDIEQLFIQRDVTEEVGEEVAKVPAQVKKFLAIQKQSEAPEQLIGSHCDKPYTCPYKHLCWADVPEYSTLNLAWGGKPKFELYHRGHVEISKIPDEAMDELRLNKRAREAVYIEREGRQSWNKKEMDAFMTEASWPMHFLDFETFQNAIPPFDNSRAWMQLPFQVSIHVQDKPGAEILHHEFLAPDGEDHRKELTAFMDQNVGPEGSIVVWHADFESGRMAEMAEAFPEYADSLQSMRERLLDLEIPFVKRWLVRPEFKGRSSIKVITPALFPELSYKNMEIGDGMQAAMDFMKSVDPGFSKEEKEKIHRDLLAYCKADTWNTVKIWQWLEEEAKRHG